MPGRISGCGGKCGPAFPCEFPVCTEPVWKIRQGREGLHESDGKIYQAELGALSDAGDTGSVHNFI